MTKKTKLKGILSPLLQHIRLKKISKIIKNDKSILDLGCDNARLIDSLKSYSHYVGIDNNPEQIEENKTKYTDKKNRFFAADLEKINLHKKFDYIVLAAIIEHIHDEKKLGKILNQASHENTKILITTPLPHSDGILKVGAKMGIFSKESLDEHDKYYTEKELTKFGEDHGFNVVNYKKFEFGVNQICVLQPKQ